MKLLLILPFLLLLVQETSSEDMNIIAELKSIKERMKVMEQEITELQRENRDQATRLETLNIPHCRIEYLPPANNELTPKVAFSAALFASDHKNIGPYPNRQTVVYEDVMTNIGNAYNHVTGIFRAPVKGVYYFTFVIFNAYNLESGMALMKNGENIVFATDNGPGADTEDTATNSVSLLLEKGDRIYMELVENRKVYSDPNKRNTFSGHLLFTM